MKGLSFWENALRVWLVIIVAQAVQSIMAKKQLERRGIKIQKSIFQKWYKLADVRYERCKK